jgi:hypothetical protein
MFDYIAVTAMDLPLFRGETEGFGVVPIAKIPQN